MKTYLAFVFVIAVVANALAQEAPTVKYSSSGQNRSVIEISNMLGEVEYMECKRVARPITGTIVKRDFEDDEVTIASFILSDAKDRRIPININDAQVGLLGRETSGIVSSLLSKGNKIQVWTYQCSGGGSGIFTYAERIKVQTSQNANRQIRMAKLKDAAYEIVASNLQQDEEGLNLTEADINSFGVELSFGDLTGDSIEEAAVSVRYNVGGTGASGRNKVFVFTLEDDELKLLGTIEGGDRAFGGLRNAKIRSNRLEVQTFTTNGDECAVCYGGVEMNKYEYIASRFVKVQYSYVGEMVEVTKGGVTTWVLKPKVTSKTVKRKKTR